MKRIEDAPKELQKMFAIVWEQCVCSASGISDYRDEVEHAFLKGFDTAMATGGWSHRKKRTITNLIKLDGQIYAISNDGKLFINHFTRPEEWKAFPDLPQD